MKNKFTKKHKNVQSYKSTQGMATLSLAVFSGLMKNIAFFIRPFSLKGLSRSSAPCARTLNFVRGLLPFANSTTNQHCTDSTSCARALSQYSADSEQCSADSTSCARALSRLCTAEAEPVGRRVSSIPCARALSLLGVLLFIAVPMLVLGQGSDTATAQANNTINFQGRLLTAAGDLVPDGDYHIEFKLYNAASSSGSSQGSCAGDSNCLWTETRSTGDLASIQNGYYSVYLGDVTALPTIDWSQPLHLTMNIGGDAGSPSWDGEMNPRFKLTAVPFAFSSQNVASSDTNAVATDSNDITIQTGDALDATSNSGNITIDTGTATGTAGQILLGTNNTSGLTLGRAGVTSTLQGSVSLTGAGTALTVTNNVQVNGNTTLGSDTSDTLTVEADATFNGTLTVSTGDTFINSGATLNTAVTIANLSTGGDIGTAGTTVDVATTFNVNQTTASQALTLPTPSDTTAGRVIYVNNVGSASFTMYGTTIGTSGSNAFIWNGTSWITTVSLSGSSVSVIGTLDSQVKSADGAVISGNAIYLQTADATAPGLVSTGAQTFAGAKTFNGDLVVGSAAGSSSVLRVNGSTQNTTLALGNFAAGGSIGTAASTIDIYTSISVNQTTSGQTLVIPDPTSSTEYGRIVYLSNVGTESFTAIGQVVAPGTSIIGVWSNTSGGASWQTSGTAKSGGAAATVATSASGGASSAVASANPNSADYINESTSSAEDTINTALTAVGNAGGGTVILMEGTYIVDGSVEIPNNVTLAGTGKGTIIKLANLHNNSINIVTNEDQTTGASVGVQNLEIDGNAANQTDTTNNTSRGINFRRVGEAGVREGGTIIDVTVRDVYGYEDTNPNFGYGIDINLSDNNRIENVTATGNTDYGIWLDSASGNTISGSTTSSSIVGIGLEADSDGNTISDNIVRDNGQGILIQSSGSSNDLNIINDNNIVNNSSNGITIGNGSDNLISGNVVADSDGSGISLGLSANTNSVTSNRITDTGGATGNRGLIISGDNNSITSNFITDDSCTTTCEAITNSGDNNYFEANRFIGSAADAATIDDTGANTIYVNQQTNSTTSTDSDVTDFRFRGSADSTTAFAVQNAAGTSILNVDTDNDELEVTGDLTVSGLTTLNGGLTVQAGDTFTFNTDAFTDFTGAGLINVGGVLAVDSTSVSGFFRNGGNSFGAAAVLGTNDAFGLSLETDGTVAVSIDATQNTTFNGNVTLAAGQSLTLIGGNTASRPAGTAGELYYDTDTNTLLTYNGTKWVADRGEYIIVAADDSTQAEKDAADYVADGEIGDGQTTLDGDQVEINAALTAASGGKVLLLAGTYIADGTILVPNNTTLAGVGNGTVIELADIDVGDRLVQNSDTTTGAGVVIRDLKLDGRDDLNTAGNQIGIYLDSTGQSNRSGAKIIRITIENFRDTGIFISGADKTEIDGVTVNNIVNGDGIYVDGKNSVVSNTNVEDTGNNGISIWSDSNTAVGNYIKNAAYSGIYATDPNNIISNNTIVDSAFYGVYGDTSVITSNIISGSGENAIYLGGDSIVSNNTLRDSGGALDNNAIFLDFFSDNNTISGNIITDSSCTSTCYAINISSAGATDNYLSDNTLGGGTINDLGTNTIYASQLTALDVLRSDASEFTSNRTLDLTGTVAVTAASDALTGTSTVFTEELEVGDRITITDTAETYTVESITNDTTAVLTENVTSTDASSAATKQSAPLRVKDSAGNVDFVVTENGDIFAPNLTGCTAINSDDNGQLGCDTATYLTSANAFLQNGNSFGATAVLGTDDTNSLIFETDDTTAITIDTSQDVTFAGSLTVAAGESIRLTGGNTASRPAGTAGEIYYDTDTNTLLTYNGTKWVADRGEYIIVAANDSTQTEKDSADYVADGTSDEDEINSALTAAAGGKVLLLAGTFVADGTILVPNNTTLQGVGPGTIIELDDIDATDNLIENSDTTTGTGVVIRDLKLDGRRDLNTAGVQDGISLTGIGSGVGGSATKGVNLTGLVIEDFRSTGIAIANSDNNIITNNFIQNANTATGLYFFNSDNNTITGNRFQGNYSGIFAQASFDNNTVSSNTFESNGLGFSMQSSTNNTISSNTFTTNEDFGIRFDTNSNDNIVDGNIIDGALFYGIDTWRSSNNIFSNNTIRNTGDSAILLQRDSNYNIISGNRISDSGGSTDNNAITFGNSTDYPDFNQIINNTVTDSSCTTTCYAINIPNSGSDNNYLADNTYSASGADQATINDAGTGTIYANQQTPTQILQNSSTLIQANASTTLTGTADPAASTTLPGTGTFFTTELQVGDRITINAETRTVTAIASDTSLTVDTAFTDTAAAAITRLPAALRVTNSSGTNSVVVNDIGATTFQNTTNTANAFRVLNTSNRSLFDIDTSGSVVNIMNTRQSGTIQIGAADEINTNQTINVGTNTAGTSNTYVTIGSDEGASNVVLQGAGGIDIGVHQDAGDINIGATNAIVTNQTINVGTNAAGTGSAVVVIGSTSTGSTTSIRGRDGITVSAADNLASAFVLQEGSQNYINLITTNSSEEIEFGNTTTDPDYTFLGTGTLQVDGTTQIGDNSSTAFLIFDGQNGVEQEGIYFDGVQGSAYNLLYDQSNSALSLEANGGQITLDFAGLTVNRDLNVTLDSTFTGLVTANGGLTIDAVSGTSGDDVTFSDASFQTCVLTTDAAGVLTCGASGTLITLQSAYQGLNTITATDAEGDIDLTVSEATNFSLDITGTGSFLVQDGGTDVFTVADGGVATFQNSSNSTSGFTINNAAGSSLLEADTANYLLKVAPTQFLSEGITQSFAVSGSVTGVDSYSTIAVNATGSDVDVTIPIPVAGGQVVGRVIYITAVNGSEDFNLSLGGTLIDISMKANSTATLIWNGTGWTAAGASSSTDLQSAYSNTLTSAGGAEIVLNPTGGAADGLTVRNNDTSPIIGAVLEVQTSIGSNLFSVNNNAVEYATNGGAETTGASASTFPAGTWSAAPDGGTVTRYTTQGDFISTGVASVSVVTGATAGHGAENTLTEALKANLRYTVSFAVRGASSFSTLDVHYSPDGTTGSLVACTTGETVTQGLWTRVICTFDAPASGITSSNAILIRQSDATARTFYLENLSVTVKADVNHAVDGDVDDAGSFATNWTATGASTTTRETGTIYNTSGSAEVVTTAAAGDGIANNLSISPDPDTQYLVTFYAQSSNTFDDIRVRYSRDGGTNFVSCVDYNTQSVSTASWTRITCLFTSDGVAPTDADLIIDQPTATARTFYVDGLEVTLNENTASNVQIGGGNDGGPTTLFTLDRSAGPPVGANNDAYLGSMYYDTTTGRIQCYESGGWGTCGAPPDNIVNLNPEYAGSVLNGSGIGTMQADVCANESGVLQVNSTLCGSGEARSFYQWTSPQATEQTYSIYVTYQLPSTFDGFASDDTVTLTGRVDNTTNADVTYEMFRSEGGSITQCGSGETTVATSVDTWQTVGINGNEATGCGFTSNSANGFVIFKLNLKAQSNANAYVSTLSFTTTGR